MMWWDDGWGMGAGGALWMVVMVAVLVLVLVGVVLLVRGFAGGRSSKEYGGGGGDAGGAAGGISQVGLAPSPVQTALRVLEERYARGEIDREEFLQKKNDLTS